MISANNQKGFSLIFLIVIMLVLAGMGAAIYTFTSSSSYTQLSENNRNRAYQLAVAGMNYAAEQYYANVDLTTLNNIYTLGDGQGTFSYTITAITGAAPPYYDVISTGTVNDTNGLLLAKAQVRSSSTPNTPNFFPIQNPEPPVNQTVMSITMENLSGLKSQDLTDDHHHTMVQVAAYVATGGTHLYWAAFTDLGTYSIPDGDNSRCDIGFHVARINDSYANQLRQSWNTYNHVDYDLQVKVGWYKDFGAAVSGLNFRWHETANNSGLFEGYGLAFMRYTYSDSGCGWGWGWGYDYIPYSIKPPGKANKLLLVLWEQRVVGGVERRRWLAYAELGTPANYSYWHDNRTGNDLKVVGAQDDADGLLSDNSLVLVRVKDKMVGGQRVNEINVFYGDGSPNYNWARTPNSVATDITRKRMFPQWIRSDLFPSWPSNKLGLFSYTDAGTPHSIYNFWDPDPAITTDPTYYDFFTLESASNKIGPQPPSTTPMSNPVQWILNSDYADTRADTSTPPANTDLVTMLSDKGTLRTYKFVLNNFETWNLEAGLHVMGNLNNSDRTVAFDDFALQILGKSEN